MQVRHHVKRRWDESKHVVIASAITIAIIFGLVIGVGYGVRAPDPVLVAPATLGK